MKMKKMTIQASFAASFICLGLLVSSVSAQTLKTVTGGFDVGPGGYQGNFNPLAATSGHTWLSMYYEPLIIYSPDLSQVVPALAESWEIDKSQTRYVFHLAKETWHDGKPVTAKDVAFSVKLAQSNQTGSVLGGFLKAVDKVEVLDDKTVAVTLTQPDVSFWDALTKVYILPEHALKDVPLEQLPKSAWWHTKPIGSGPFKFSKYVTDQYVELTADDDYRNGRPQVDRLINRYFADSAAAVSALRAGEIQFTYVEPNDVPAFKDNPAFSIIEGSSFVANFIGFNNEVPLWKDTRVRQAVMHAIDREAIIKNLYGGAATPAACGYAEKKFVPDDVNPYAYDSEKARALLKEAGWDKINGNKPIPWLTYYANPLVANVMAAIQAQLAAVGINVVPRAVDGATYNSIVYAKKPQYKDYPLVFAGLQNGPDPSFINVGLNESQIPPQGSNIMRIRMPELNDALNAALKETNPDARAARYQDVCRVMNAKLPWATMWVANRYGVASSKLKDFVWIPAPGGGPFAAHPEKWSIAD